MATFERDFIAGSANTISRAVLWLKSRALPSPIVVFAIDNLVAIANAYDKVYLLVGFSKMMWLGNYMHSARAHCPD